MSSEIIQNVAYDNYDDFQHVNVIISQIFISLFWGLFIDEIDLRVRYLSKEFLTLVGAPSSPYLDPWDVKIPPNQQMSTTLLKNTSKSILTWWGHISFSHMQLPNGFFQTRSRNSEMSIETLLP
jgi:hypothetical protein